MSANETYWKVSLLAVIALKLLYPEWDPLLCTITGVAIGILAGIMEARE